MDKKLKAKWIKALRSGKFKQTKGELKNKAGYCCLGVLRHIIAPTSKARADTGDWLGKKHTAQSGLDEKAQRSLAGLNDEGHTFAQIADHIEAKF